LFIYFDTESSPAFETFQIKPQLSNLTFANLTTPTIKGAITVNFSKNTEGGKMEVIVPSCTTATVYVPQFSSKMNVSIDGKKSSILPRNGYFIVENVKAGKHIFVLK
jgi:alpha-L-rhamnosidase